MEWCLNIGRVRLSRWLYDKCDATLVPRSDINNTGGRGPHSGPASTCLPSGTGSVSAPMRARMVRGRLGLLQHCASVSAQYAFICDEARVEICLHKAWEGPSLKDCCYLCTKFVRPPVLLRAVCLMRGSCSPNPVALLSCSDSAMAQY